MPISPYVRRLRDAVGSERLFLPSVAGLVRAPGGRLLLVQNRDTGDWTTPGGVIEVDETPATAVAREVWEETGILVTPRLLFGVYGGPHFLVHYPNGDETQYISIMFECDVVSGEPRPDGDETMDVRFHTLDEARALRLSPWLVEVLARLYDQTSLPWFEPTDWRPNQITPRT
jgi:8-oxo-dGTP pyrophosphatase MutT (NUDIX family)